jgi:HEAT repeats
MKISQDEDTQITVAEYAGLIDPGNNQVVDFIIERIQSDIDKDKLKFAIYILGKIGNTNQKALNILLHLINSFQEKEIHKTAIMSLGEIACKNPKAFTALQNLSSSSLDKDILNFGKHILSELNRGRKSFFSFSEPLKSNLISIPAIVSQLYKLQEASHDKKETKYLESIIGKILSSNKIEVVDALLELIINNDYTSIRWEAIDALGEIAQGNQSAIDVLVELINNSQSSNVRWKAVKALAVINPNNKIIADTLVDLIGKRHKILFSSSLFMYIGKFCCGSLQAIDALLNLMKNSNDDYDTNASKSLQIILTNPYMSKVVMELKQLLEETSSNDKRDKDCIAIIWHCAQNMSYPDFYKAWHKAG